VIRLLTRNASIPEALYKALSKALRKYEGSDTFFIAMDALVSLKTNSAYHICLFSKYLH